MGVLTCCFVRMVEWHHWKKVAISPTRPIWLIILKSHGTGPKIPYIFIVARRASWDVVLPANVTEPFPSLIMPNSWL